jgi:cytochrome c biogenesis protein CcmG/thiol:disulfide interchange protein DsbE
MSDLSITRQRSTRVAIKFGWLRLTICGLAALCAVGCDRGDHPEQVGKVAPQFTVHDADRTVDLSRLRGKVVVLNFWASWCAPCLEELPSLEALQHTLPQVTVLAVSTDDDSTAYKKFLQEHHVDLLAVQDAAQTSNALYGTYRYPETYIIDKNGMIRRKYIGPQDFMSSEIVDSIKRLAQ